MSYRITKNRPLSYYKHFLVKNRLIIFPETEGEYPYMLGQCTDKNCYNCNQLFPDKCLKCATGFFLYNNNCEKTCPDNFIANTLLLKCTPRELLENSFLMAYSIGSCVNRCGKKSADCSCSPQCKKNGNCCSDYNIHDCDKILDSSANVKDKCPSNCELCDAYELDEDTKKPLCIQCKPGKYIFANKCFDECPEDTFANENNNECLPINNCSVKNCESCLFNNILYCKKCVNGWFLFEGECYKVCPAKFRADRINWTCKEYSTFSWYWVHPSKGTCNKNCGSEQLDCSCNSDCYREGNCCQDADSFCLHFNILRKKEISEK